MFRVLKSMFKTPSLALKTTPPRVKNVSPRVANPLPTASKTASKTGVNPHFRPVTPPNPVLQRGSKYNYVLQRMFIDRKFGGFTTKRIFPGHRYVSVAVQLSQVSARKQVVSDAFIEDLAMQSHVNSVRAWRDRGILVYEFELPEMHWKFYNAGDIAPGSIGVAGIGRPVTLDFSETNPHAGVFGISGSGKTTTIRTALYALAKKYNPRELQFVISDPNSYFSDFANVAHLAAPVAVSRDDSEALIRWTYAQFRQRRDNDIKDAPRLVLVFDEAIEVIPEPTKTPDEITKMVSDIAKLGRGFNVSLLFGTQEPLKTRFPGIFSQIANRYVGKVDSASTSTNISGQAQLYAHKLTGKGDFLHVQPNGEGLRFQAAQVSQRDIDELDRAEVKKLPVIAPQIVDYDDDNDDNRTGGRPQVGIDGRVLYQYYKLWPKLPSIRSARDDFGIGRKAHNMHKKVITEFMECVEEE